jgi:DNA-binding transcriptional ArsR family regulator
MIEFTEARKVAAMMAAIAEPTRLMILHQLTEGPRHVGQLARTLDIPMVNMSHHLGVMRSAGILEDHKNGRRVQYALRPEIYRPGGSPDAIGTLSLGSYRLILLKSNARHVLTPGRRRSVRRRSADAPAGE